MAGYMKHNEKLYSWSTYTIRNTMKTNEIQYNKLCNENLENMKYETIRLMKLQGKAMKCTS